MGKRSNGTIRRLQKLTFMQMMFLMEYSEMERFI